MKLFKLTRKTPHGHDEYDSVVVCCETKECAKYIHPSDYCDSYSWVKPSEVIVEYIGEAKTGTKSGVILASYNAG